MESRAVNSTIAKPFEYMPSQFWEGNDGSWSTFIVQVGTPAQTFRALISTAGQETWVPLEDACVAGNSQTCGEVRGVQPFRNSPSDGFRVNESSTWQSNNLYKLGLEEHLGYTGNGKYGYEKVGLMLQDSDGPVLDHQVVAGIVTTDFMLGVFGLGTQPTHFTDFNEPQQSFMSSLRNQNIIPSLSYGYTAGAPYKGKKVLGSLTLGGYDASRLKPTNLSMSFGSDDSRNLLVGLQSIEADHTLSGIVSFLSKGIFSLIDSTVPDIWLPESACKLFESAFGLQFDNNTNRYLVNDTVHTKLQELNPTITFKLGNSVYGGETTNIILSYAAFDLQAKYPIYPNATNYFPIRRAANETQYTIGRTFLQEAYLIVDYDRSNFSISQAVFPDNSTSDIVSILPPGVFKYVEERRLGHGTIIGITVGLSALIILTVGYYLLYRKHQKRKESEALQAERESKNAMLAKLKGVEVPDNAVYEASGQSWRPEVDGGMLPEIGGNEIMAEMKG